MAELNIYKFYVANVLYRGSCFPFFHAAMRIYDCVTFYLILCFFSYVYEADQFFIKQKKVFLRQKKKPKKIPFLLLFIHDFVFGISHKVS